MERKSGGHEGFVAALREWKPLLELLLHSLPSPVGAAVHWVRSQGYSGPASSSNRTCLGSQLWRLVPDLLAYRVALLTSCAEQHSEGDTAKCKRAIHSCMWMQTLPSIVQANILGFLCVEHTKFHASDLELLAVDLLSDGQIDFWVCRAAHKLLSKVGGLSKVDKVLFPAKEFRGNYALPSWLCEYKSELVLPWLPVAAHSVAIPTKDSCKAGTMRSGLDIDTCPVAENTLNVKDGMSKVEYHGDQEMRRESDDTTIVLQTPPYISEGRKRTFEQPKDSENLSVVSVKKMEICEYSKSISVGPEAGTSEALCALAESLREAWLDRQPTSEDLQTLSALPHLAAFLKLVRPWEMRDDTVLSMIEVFLGKDSGFAWSCQILSHCLLPKLLHLEQPASRFLVSAVTAAAKVHPRATVDALLVPLFLCEKGPTKVHCDVIHRLLKDSLPERHGLALCGKIVLQSRRQPLLFAAPPCIDLDVLGKSVIWSEPAWTVLQMTLECQNMDEELLEALIKTCGEEVVVFARSLKFTNLLLCLVTNFGFRLIPYKSSLQRIAERTETFLTKSLITKVSAL